MTKLQMLDASRRCLIFGLLAWLPIIGIPFGIVALVVTARARAAEKQYWNAARPYRLSGEVSAALAVILWTFVLILIGWNLLNPGP